MYREKKYAHVATIKDHWAATIYIYLYVGSNDDGGVESLFGHFSKTIGEQIIFDSSE